MKKLLKVTALLLVAAAMFAGCSSPSSSNPTDPYNPPSTGGNTLDDEGVLFDNALATDTITSAVELSDGNWVATYKSVVDNSVNFQKSEFTISDSGTKVHYTSKTTILYDDITKRIYSKTEASSAELSSFDGTTTSDVGNYSMEYLSLINLIIPLETHKCNSELTKYFANGIQNASSQEAVITIYIMKKE